MGLINKESHALKGGAFRIEVATIIYNPTSVLGCHVTMGKQGISQPQFPGLESGDKPSLFSLAA
jgi:hypothetical protein